MPTINVFAGAETGGVQEASTVASSWSAINDNTSILVNDGYHYRGVGPSVRHSIIFPMTDYVAFEDNNLIVSFALEFLGWPGSTETVVSIHDSLEISVGATGTLTLLDSNAGSLDTFAASLNTLYEIEIYLQKSNASGAWEWRINGVSEGSGTGADLLGAEAAGDNLFFRVTSTSFGMDVNNIVVRSGCTTTDWLGTGISVCALATSAGTPTEGGDALSSGAMVNTQITPLDTTEAQFDAGTARNRWIQSDADVWSIYYFDASDAGPTDNDAVWTNDANAFDGSTATAASCSTSGTETTNELRGEGTNAPAGATSTISGVRCRIYGTASGFNQEMSANVYADGGTELLGIPKHSSSSSTTWGAFTTLSAPAGGWTWAKVAALEVVVWGVFQISAMSVRIIQVQVAHDDGLSRTPTALGLTNTIACKLFMDS